MNSRGLVNERTSTSQKIGKYPVSEKIAAAVLALVLSSGAVEARDCSPKRSVESDPSWMTQIIRWTKMNPFRTDVALSTKVSKENHSETGESGTFSVRSWNFGSWQCNYSSVRGADGEIRQVTARHCIDEKFQGVSRDYWDSAEFSETPLRVNVAKRTRKILEFSEFPNEGDIVTVVGCFPAWMRECFKITGFFNELYSRGEEKTYGIWISPPEYAKMVRGEIFSSLEGLSWSPALDAEGKVFGTVSATIFADHRESVDWSCSVGNYAVVLALMPRTEKKSEQGDLARK